MGNTDDVEAVARLKVLLDACWEAGCITVYIGRLCAHLITEDGSQRRRAADEVAARFSFAKLEAIPGVLSIGECNLPTGHYTKGGLKWQR